MEGIEITKLLKKLNLKDKSPEFYQYYPQLFHFFFADVKNSEVNNLSNAGYLYYLSYFMLDSIIIDD